MKIFCTVTNDLSQDQRMIRICSTLQRAGYEVHLIGRLLPGSLPLAAQPFQQHRLFCYFRKGKWFYLEYNLRLLFFLLRHRCELINAVDLDTLLPAFLVSRWRRIPCVYDAHEYFTEVPEVVHRPRIQKVWNALANWIIPQLNYCYTVGPALAQIMGERYRTPFAVVRNLPLRRMVEAVPAPAGHIILYQGALNEGRGLEVAIAALPDLPTCELWLIGDGDVKAALQQQVATLYLTERVRFLGFVMPADLPAYTTQAWLGLNLLENRGLSYYYSLANKAFDYVQVGLLSLQMDFPEYRSLQDQYGVFALLPDLSVSSFVATVSKLLDDPVCYQEIRQNCLRATADLCWEQEEGHLLRFYEQVVAQR